jgi:HK97 family phage prohead protease
MGKIAEQLAVSGQYRGLRKTDKDEKVFTFVASNSYKDRHNTILNVNGWELENFRINPIIGYQHNLYGDMCNAPDPDDVIGRALDVWVKDGELLVDVVFDQENEKARKIESKVERGFLNTVSVGFIRLGEARKGDKKKGEDPETYYYDGQELVEVSVVNIPSNPKAAKKSFRSQTFDALKYIYRELGGNFRLSEIEDMKVRDILDLLDGKEPEKKEIKKPLKRQIKYEVI